MAFKSWKRLCLHVRKSSIRPNSNHFQHLTLSVQVFLRKLGMKNRNIWNYTGLSLNHRELEHFQRKLIIFAFTLACLVLNDLTCYCILEAAIIFHNNSLFFSLESLPLNRWYQPPYSLSEHQKDFHENCYGRIPSKMYWSDVRNQATALLGRVFSLIFNVSAKIFVCINSNGNLKLIIL